MAINNKDDKEMVEIDSKFILKRKKFVIHVPSYYKSFSRYFVDEYLHDLFSLNDSGRLYFIRVKEKDIISKIEHEFGESDVVDITYNLDGSMTLHFSSNEDVLEIVVNKINKLFAKSK